MTTECPRCGSKNGRGRIIYTLCHNCMQDISRTSVNTDDFKILYERDKAEWDYEPDWVTDIRKSYRRLIRWLMSIIKVK